MSHWHTLRAIYGHLQTLLTIPFLAYALLSFWRDEGPEKRQPPRALDVLFQLPWWVGVFLALVTLLWVTFSYAHKLRTARERIPPNRTELISAIHEYAAAATKELHAWSFKLMESRFEASPLARDSLPTRVLRRLGRKYPLTPLDVMRSLPPYGDSNRYVAARQALELQTRVSGQNFYFYLDRFRVFIDAICAIQYQPLIIPSDFNVGRLIDAVERGVQEILVLMDSGKLYVTNAQATEAGELLFIRHFADPMGTLNTLP